MTDDAPPHAEAVAHAVEAHARIRERADESATRIRNRRGIRRKPDRWEPYS